MKKRFFSFFLAVVLAVSALAGGLTAQAATNTKSGTASDIVAVALAQKQGSSGATYIKWYWGDNKSHAWCAAFVSWCANQAGADFAIKKNASCASMYNAVLKAGGTVVSESNVKPGDLLFFKNSSGTLCHVAIVTAGSGTSATATHGNFSWNGSGYVVNQGIKVTSNFYDVNGNKCTRVYLRPAYNSASTGTTGGGGDQSSSSATPNMNGSYSLINKASGSMLDVYGNTSTSTNKSNVQIYTSSTDNDSQKFKVTLTAGGWYTITPFSNSKLAVNPYSNTPKNGTNVNAYTLDSSDKTQGWLFEKVGDYYVIRSAYNNSLALTAEGTANMSNVKLATYSANNSYQLWSLVPPGGTTTSTPTSTAPVSGTTYTIINKASGRALDVYGSTSSSTNKSNVQVYTNTASNKSQQFKVVLTSSGWYSIIPVSNSGLAVNPYSDTPANGTNVNVYTLDASDKTQGWVFEKVGDYYVIHSAYNNSLVLTAEGNTNMSNVKLATYSAGNNYQLWSLS